MAVRREAFDLDDISDAAVRKNIFREFGKDLSASIRSGRQTDAPGAVARLMEQAFRAGLALGADTAFKPTDKDDARVVTDMNVPSLPREQLYIIRMSLGIDPFGRGGSRTGKCRSEALVMFMRPRDRRLPSTMSRDAWLHVGRVSADGLSSKVVNPLIKMGLYEEPWETQGEWRIAFMTEWGFELMVTGQTSGVKQRHEGGSSTYEEYSRLVGQDRWAVVQRAGKELQVIG